MTSPLPGRVMGGLSSLLARFALPLLATLGLTGPARGQIPFTPPASDSVPVPETPAPGPPAAPPSTPAPLAPVPTLPAAPAGPEPARSVSQPTPTRADQLKEPPTTVSEPARDDDEEDGTYSEAPRRSWYGWQTLTADGISTVLLVTGAAKAGSRSDDTGEALAWIALAGYEFAPGIIHFAHRNPGRGFASFGIRLGMPLAGAFVGGAVASGCSGYECEAGGAGVGFLLGMAGAIAIDAAVLAFDYPERNRPATARVLPVVSLSRGQTFIGLAGEL